MAGRDADRRFEPRVRRLYGKGRLDEAAGLCRRWLAASGRSAAPLRWMGRIAGALGDGQAALRLLTEAAGLAPGDVGIESELGEALDRLGRFDEAAAVYGRLLERHPDLADCRLRLASALREARRPEAALAQLDRLLAERPDEVEARDLAATCLVDLGRHAEARPHLEAVAAARPDAALSWRRLATVCLAIGRLDEAEAHLRRGLAIDPHDAEAHLRLSAIVRHGPGHPDIEAIERELSRPGLDRLARQNLCFALGRARANAGDHAAAFAAYQEANRLKRSTFDYDPAATEALFEAIETVFAGPLPALPGPLPDHPRLLFIVGMPRSGTTLCERILDGHPSVRGVGESRRLSQAIEAAMLRTGRRYPEGIRALDGEALAAIGRDCHAGLLRQARWSPGGEATVIVDKMPHNFRYLGVIAHLWPEAVIVAMRRDPLDVCLSCFEQHFSGNHPYAYDLDELGRYYLAYDRLMRFWRRRLPGRIVDVDYADLVTDPRSVVEPVLARLGLDWDAHCGAFNERDGTVTTASLVQVRQPLYRSSIGRWRRYERELAGLRALLDEGGAKSP